MYNLSKEECDRINIVKCVAIFFVVYIHAYTQQLEFSDGSSSVFLPQWLRMFENLISQVIARCGVPLFF